MKPVNGGSPPRERSSRGARAVTAGNFTQDRASALRVVALFRTSIRKVEDVMIK